MKKFWINAKVWILCAMLLSVYLAYPQRTFACRCGMPGSPAEALADSTAVFTGRVIQVDPPIHVPNEPDQVRVVFKVSQVWKGSVQDQLAVTTSESGIGSCGFSFSLTRKYIIYASGTTNRLTVSQCDRSNLLINAQSDIAALGVGQIPPGASSGDILLGFLVLIISLILIGIMMVVGVVWRRKMRRRAEGT